jgi:hypothetical protein
MTASAFPSMGVDDLAARLAVQGLGMLGPGGEVRGSVAVPVYGKAAPVAAEDALDQPHLLLDRPAP